MRIDMNRSYFVQFSCYTSTYDLSLITLVLWFLIGFVTNYVVIIITLVLYTNKVNGLNCFTIYDILNSTKEFQLSVIYRIICSPSGIVRFNFPIRWVYILIS